MPPICPRLFRYKQRANTNPYPSRKGQKSTMPGLWGCPKATPAGSPEALLDLDSDPGAPNLRDPPEAKADPRPAFCAFLCRVQLSEKTSQEKTHLSSSSPSWKAPTRAGFLGGKRRDLPPNGVLGGKKRGFLRKRFRLSILASRSRSSCLWGTRKWFIQFLFFGKPVFFEMRDFERPRGRMR